jgi:hypothetical protein
MRRKLSITIAAAALLAGLSIPQALGAGGLSISPAIIEHLATPGAVGTVVVKNATTGPLAVTVTPRPWNQARSGAVAPNRHKKLTSQVRVSAAAFSLPAGASKPVTLTLIRTGSGRSLYGSIEVIGTPPKPKKRAGIVAAFRLIGSLRLNPPPALRKLRVKIGSVRITGKGAKRQILVGMTNTGNTVEPITGTVRVKGARGTRTVSVTAKRVVPGATIDLPLGVVKGLPKGSYTARVGLFEAGKSLPAQTRKFRIR